MECGGSEAYGGFAAVERVDSRASGSLATVKRVGLMAYGGVIRAAWLEKARSTLASRTGAYPAFGKTHALGHRSDFPADPACEIHPHHPTVVGRTPSLTTGFGVVLRTGTCLQGPHDDKDVD